MNFLAAHERVAFREFRSTASPFGTPFQAPPMSPPRSESRADAGELYSAAVQ